LQQQERGLVKKVNRQTIFFPLIFLLLTYCLLGCDKEGVGTNSTTQKNVTSTNKTIKRDEEIKKIKEDLVSNPNNYEAHYNLGTLYEEEFMLDEAFKAYKKAALLNPSSEDPLIGQGRILNKKSDYYGAVSMLEKAFRNNQDKMETYYYLGLAYAKTGNPDNSIVLWQGAIDKSRNKSNTYYLKGLIHKQKGDFETAETLLKNAITINPEFAAAHMVLEALYSSNGRYGDAYRHAEIHRKTKQHLQSNKPEKQVASISENKIPLDESPKSTKISQKGTTEMVAEQTKTFTINGINDAISYSGEARMLSMQMAKLYGIQVLKGYPVDKK
jgi:tetratricopeptide (TPR) repeat protein